MVDAATVREEAVVTVADSGIGIPAADFDRLFERYHRGSNVSGIVGTGVGLYLVKMTVELHGGSVEVRSKEGEGSHFTVRLPLRPASAARHWPPNDASEIADAPPIMEVSGEAVLSRPRE
jgi:signal transduction histidine kinase